MNYFSGLFRLKVSVFRLVKNGPRSTRPRLNSYIHYTLIERRKEKSRSSYGRDWSTLEPHSRKPNRVESRRLFGESNCYDDTKCDSKKLSFLRPGVPNEVGPSSRRDSALFGVLSYSVLRWQKWTSSCQKVRI